MKTLLLRWLAPVVLVAAAAVPMAAGAAAPPTRGELLYDAHCIECHTTQIHWRALKVARDWATLKAQVIRWQAIARLGWDEADVVEVTRHLNATIYRFPPLSPPQVHAPRRERVAVR